jgi:hypothetical protein
VRLKWLGCFLVLLSAMIMASCSNVILGGSSGGSTGPQPTSLAVTMGTNSGPGCTTSSPCGMVKGAPTPLALVATGTFPGGSKQNLTSTVTWTASPAGIVTLKLSTTSPVVENVSGVATGTVTITATSTNALTATATVVVNPPTLSTVTVTPLGEGLAAGATANYAATANFSDGSTQVVTTSASWTSSTSGVATVGATTGVVKAVAAGQTTISATYQGVTGSTALNVVTTAAYSNASLNGDYAFTLTATGTNAAKQSVPEYFVGSLSFDGQGNITGAMDSNTTGGVATNVTVTGTAEIFADGRGTLTLTGSGLPSSSYRLVLTSNLLGTISGQFVQFDGKGAAIGTLIQQVAATSLSASEVFRFTGIDSAGNPFGEVGEFTTGAGNTVTSGEFDENDFGTVTQLQTISGGSYTAPATNGRGTLKLTLGGTTSNFVFYAVQAGNLILLSTDTGAPVLLGYAEEQSGTFNDGTLANNTGYGFLLERSPASGRGLFDTIGRIGFNGAGGVNGGAQDEVSGAANDPINSGTYSVASNGRAPVTVVTGDSGTLTYIYYLVTANRAYILETNDSYGAAGTADIQSGVTLTDSVLTGNYGFTGVDLSQSQGTSAVVWMSANGQGSVQGIGDVVSGTSVSSVILSGTYSVAVIGRTVILPSAPVGAESFIFYVVSPNESYMLGVLPSFDGLVFIQ